MKSHAEKYANPGKGKASYLSSTICDEVLSLMTETVLKVIKDEIKQAKYFSLIVDSTPDVSNTDQLCLVLRYCKEDEDIVERFICFVLNCSHKASDMEEVILQTLESLDVSISDCRGQSYDNAANMSGKYNGVQAKIKVHSPTAFSAPCIAHNLNLVGVSAAECCKEARDSFLFVQNLYTFFSGSTHRWKILRFFG